MNYIPAINVEEIHSRLLLMLKSLHDICISNNIIYYMIGGTALGARRHGGFIPWDDDIDIGMPRPDYERFSKLGRDKFPDFLERRWYKNTADSPFQFIKLIDNRTTLKEFQYDDYVEGLYIDIFPLDGVKPDSFFESLRRRSIWLQHSLIIRRCSTLEGTSYLGKIARKVIKKISMKKLHDRLEKTLLKVSYADSVLVANFLGAWREREIMDKRLFGTPALYRFEDSSFFAPEKIDDYLTRLYGDFMTPPPPEKQVLRHNYSLLDFNMPYREYELNQKKQHKDIKR